MTATVAQISESSRRAERRFDPQPTRHTALDDLRDESVKREFADSVGHLIRVAESRCSHNVMRVVPEIERLSSVWHYDAIAILGAVRKVLAKGVEQGIREDLDFLILALVQEVEAE